MAPPPLNISCLKAPMGSPYDSWDLMAKKKKRVLAFDSHRQILRPLVIDSQYLLKSEIEPSLLILFYCYCQFHKMLDLQYVLPGGRHYPMG